MNEGALQVLLAKQEITEAIHNYCRAMDRMDNDLGRSVFHPDAEVDYGTMFRGSGHGFIDFVYGTHKVMLVHAHQIGNISISIDGDRAGSESYVTATLRRPIDGGGIVEIRSHGRYIDNWEKRDGRWAISRRQYLHAMDETRPIAAADYAIDGARDRSDPSYACLGTVGTEQPS